MNRSSTIIGLAALYWCLAGPGCNTIPYESWEKPQRQQILHVPVKEIDPAHYRFNVMCLLVGEFSDFAATHWRVKFPPEWGISENPEFQEPAAYTRKKRKAVANPEFSDSSGIDKILLGRRVNPDFDSVRLETFPSACGVFEFLKAYRGPPLDRLIIYSHGNSQALGHNNAPESSILIEKLFEHYCRADFSHLMKKGGHALLMSCGTNEDYATKLTIGEVISWLLLVPVTGATKEDVISVYKIYTPNMATVAGVRQHDLAMGGSIDSMCLTLDLSVPFIFESSPQCRITTGAPYVTVYPMSDDQLQKELNQQNSKK